MNNPQCVCVSGIYVCCVSMCVMCVSVLYEHVCGVCVYVSVCIYACVCTCVFYMGICVICVHICVWVSLCVYECLCVLYGHVCVCICMCVWVFPISFPWLLKGNVNCHSINHKCYWYSSDVLSDKMEACNSKVSKNKIVMNTVSESKVVPFTQPCSQRCRDTGC